jgi:hypothetical protein
MTEFRQKLKVTFCYSPGAEEPTKRLYYRLQQCNLELWLDKLDLIPGSEPERETNRVFSQSDIILICLDYNAQFARGLSQRFIKKALEIAKEQPADSIFLIPVKLDEKTELPADLAHLTPIEFFGEGAATKLIRTLEYVASLKGRAVVQPPQTLTRPPEVNWSKLDQLNKDLDLYNKQIRMYELKMKLAENDTDRMRAEYDMLVATMTRDELLEKKTRLEKRFNATNGPGLSLDKHFDWLIYLLQTSQIVPILGSGVNLYGRPEDAQPWQPKSPFPPTNIELAQYLGQQYQYQPEAAIYTDLARISQYGAVMERPEMVYSRLRDIFYTRYSPSYLHRFFANLPQLLRRKLGRLSCPVIVTTSYDTLLETAFQDNNEEYDLLTYKLNSNEERYCFFHRTFRFDGTGKLRSGPEHPITIKTRSGQGESGLSLGQRTVILKLNRWIDLQDTLSDSWVVTEDDFITMARSKISSLLPPELVNTLRKSNLLFVGYNMRDWSLRVILHDIWNINSSEIRGKVRLAIDSGTAADNADSQFWRSWETEPVVARLEDYIGELERRLEEDLDRRE